MGERLRALSGGVVALLGFALGILAAVVLLFAAAAPASASAWRTCGSGGAAIGPEYEWVVGAPYHIKMSNASAAQIASHVGEGEFGAPGTTVREVPCVVAQEVASAAAEAWLHWSANTGWVYNAKWIGYASGPRFGAFHCTGVSRDQGGANERCEHKPDHHEGEIIEHFTIKPNPYN